MQPNFIECHNTLLPESIEAISTDDDDFYSETNSISLNANTDKNFIKTSWAIKYGITHFALSPLLEILNTFTNAKFPKDPRILLQTLRNTDVLEMGNGQFCHFDIINIVKKNDN